MDNKKWYVSSAIIAVGIMVLGFFIKSGIAGFTENSRVVTVKGLAEKEVKADKVLVFKKIRRKGFQTLNGHRQKLSKIRINEIA